MRGPMLPPIPSSIWLEGRWNQSNRAPTVQTWTSVTGSCSENWSIYSGMKNSTPTRTSPRACSGSQTKWSKFGWQAFLWDAWVKYTTVSNPKLPKKHDNVYHFDPSQMVLELINLRQSFPNNLISWGDCRCLIHCWCDLTLCSPQSPYTQNS